MTTSVSGCSTAALRSVVDSGIDQRSLKAVAALLAPGVHDLDLVAAALAVQGVRVEVADESGAEHRDPVAVHEWLLLRGGRGGDRGPGRARRPWRASLARVAQRAVWLNPQSGTSVSRSGGTPAASTASVRSATSSA